MNIDPLNVAFNSTCLLNISIAQSKLNQNDQALKTLNHCLALNPEYAKALVKRGEINESLENYEEAIRDFHSASEIDKTGFGVQ